MSGGEVHPIKFATNRDVPLQITDSSSSVILTVRIVNGEVEIDGEIDEALTSIETMISDHTGHSMVFAMLLSLIRRVEKLERAL